LIGRFAGTTTYHEDRRRPPARLRARARGAERLQGEAWARAPRAPAGARHSAPAPRRRAAARRLLGPGARPLLDHAAL